jgi:hypothetical protein
MVLGRPKKSPKKKVRPPIVPSEPPLFSELERQGLVVVMSERAGTAKPPLSGPKRTKKT